MPPFVIWVGLVLLELYSESELSCNLETCKTGWRCLLVANYLWSCVAKNPPRGGFCTKVALKVLAHYFRGFLCEEGFGLALAQLFGFAVGFGRGFGENFEGAPGLAHLFGAPGPDGLGVKLPAPARLPQTFLGGNSPGVSGFAQLLGLGAN